MVKTRSRRDDAAPGPDGLVLRGLLVGTVLEVSELRETAVLNHELYGFYGISVWLAAGDQERSALETTKLVKFEQYAEFTVASVTASGLRLDPTGQRPHYDVVYEDSADELAALLAQVPYQVRVNPHVDREEH